MHYLITAVLLLAVTTSVQAACAWVLWKGTGSPLSSVDMTWELQSAAGKEEQCRQRMEEHARKLLDFYAAKAKRINLAPGVETIVVKLGQDERITQFTCLPDTVKPRGSPY
jgi:hypothetical protein